MKWFNEPSKWSDDNGEIMIHVEPRTDFWRITDSGLIRDNGHIYGQNVNTDFTLSVRIRAAYTAQFDHAGVAVRIDDTHWIKTGVELFDGALRFSVVITADHSNWMIADLPKTFDTLNLSLVRSGDAIHISYSTDDDHLRFASIAYLEPKATALVGAMCASPDGDGFEVHFSNFNLATS
jgi:regulation of enolase protein 1 (concanavalin A-like superfamily)